MIGERHGPLNVPTTLNLNSSQARGLIALWSAAPGNQSGKASVYDLTGRGTNGAILAGAAIVAKPYPDVGWAFQSPGTGAIDMGVYNPGAVGSYQPYLTLSVWVRPQAPQPQGLAMLMAKNSDEQADFYCICLWPFNTGSTLADLQPTIYCKQGGTAKYPAGPTGLVTADWHLLTGVINDHAISIYFDGQYRAGDVFSSGLTVPGGASFYLCGQNRGGYPWLYKGAATDFRVYNRALSAAEIWTLYDPRTRWELYEHITTRPMFSIPESRRNPPQGGGSGGTGGGGGKGKGRHGGKGAMANPPGWFRIGPDA